MATIRRPGRPIALTSERADRLVALLGAGASVPVAARALGVDPATIRNWRARAWSQRPQDQPFVELEKRLQAAAAQGQVDWEASAAWLEREFGERWSLPDPFGQP
jgi:transposase-like protein